MTYFLRQTIAHIDKYIETGIKTAFNVQIKSVFT